MDEEFSGRIKNIEDKLKGTTPTEKKPKDLLRAIGSFLVFYLVLVVSFFFFFFIPRY